ncbi:MAG: serine/threonine protein kinase [Pirellulaceae bacterium]|nr:serine/threonine protein kinase [Pirellulaceae bacterium]
MTQLDSNLRPLLASGSVVGGYCIERPLGSGGMADVYYAVDQRLERPVALKILRPALAEDETYQQRFEQEAKAAAALIHPNIVQIYGVGQDGSIRYMAQEFVPGVNLRDYLRGQLVCPDGQALGKLGSSSDIGRISSRVGDELSQEEAMLAAAIGKDRQLPIREALSILLQTLAALTKSAQVGIVHRDIKPENIMLTSDGDVKVADYGLAHIQLGETASLTNPGVALGTPIYMSPEQVQGQSVDIRSDLYSLGVTLFHMLMGRPPYRGDTPLALAMQHVQAALPDIKGLRPDLPQSLVGLLKKLLAKSPEERFSSPAEVLSYLQQHRDHDLSDHWPDRTMPLYHAAMQRPPASDATRKLQELLNKPPHRRLRRALLGVAVGVPLALALWLGARGLGATVWGWNWPGPDALFAADQLIYEGIPRQSEVAKQYLWAMLDRSSSRIAKWEAVEVYFPRSAAPLNRLYVGLAQLQLARQFQEAGDLQLASRRLKSLVDDAHMQALVQAYAWLQLATIERENGDKAQMEANVRKALRLRGELSKKDVQQLDAAVRSMPSDIELYWSPSEK